MEKQTTTPTERGSDYQRRNSESRSQIAISSSNACYQKDDVSCVAQLLMSKHGYEWTKQLRVVEGYGKLKEILDTFVSTVKDQVRYVLFRRFAYDMWLVFYVHENAIYYRHPLGDAGFNKIKNIIIDERQMGFQDHLGNELPDDNCCGPMTLRNLEIILEEHKKWNILGEFKGKSSNEILELQNQLKKKFEAIKFATRDDAGEAKETFEKMLRNQRRCPQPQPISPPSTPAPEKPPAPAPSPSPEKPSPPAPDPEKLPAPAPAPGKPPAPAPEKPPAPAPEKPPTPAPEKPPAPAPEKVPAPINIFDDDLDDLSRNPDFMQDIGTFLGIFSNYFDLGNVATPYIEALDKVKCSPSLQFSLNDLQKLRKDFMDSPQMKDVKEQEDFKSCKVKTDGRSVDCPFDVEKKFPKEMKSFSKIVAMLAIIESDSEQEEATKKVASKLNLNYEKLRKMVKSKRYQIEAKVIDVQNYAKLFDVDENYDELFEVENCNSAQEKPKPPPEAKDEETEVCDDEIEMLSSKLPEFKERIDVKDASKSVDEFVKEMEFAYDWEPIEVAVKEKVKEARNEAFRETFSKVEAYSETWKSKSLCDINKWAKSRKGKISGDEVYETIATIDRANSLITGGFKLRKPQVLSILATIQAPKDRGLICQIPYGEGKSLMTSLLATLKMMMGATNVDVITNMSSPLQDGRLFYKVFDITQGAIEHKHSKKPYGVTYGTLEGFKTDHIKRLWEGIEQRHKGIAIFDELDDATIGEGDSMNSISDLFPGMDSLKYVFTKIWQELYKFTEKEDLLNEAIEELREELNWLETESGLSDPVEVQKQVNSFMAKRLLQKLKKSKPMDGLFMVAPHLREFAKGMVDVWIRKAIYARYECHEDVHYVLEGPTKDEIVPISYKKTGMALQSTIWSDGLLQFLQLKHSLNVTAESAVISHVSNVEYIKLYGNNIIALTGTLGSDSDYSLLYDVYNMSYVTIPASEESKMEEYEGEVIEDEHWANYVAYDAFLHARENRSVLIICRTIRDSKMLREYIEAINEIESFEELMIITSESPNFKQITGEKLKPHAIIIGTSNEFRRIKLDTSDELEKNGGLHVCVSFLPSNQRLQDQMFGRTARQGKRGSGQLVIRKSDTSDLDIDYESSDIDFEDILKERDDHEETRLSYVRKFELPRIYFHDKMFSRFIKLYNEFKKSGSTDISHTYAVQDFKELWWFWLKKQSFDSSDLSEKNIEEAFGNFKRSASNILEGRICRNPYYCITVAEVHLEHNNADMAENFLKQAIDMSSGYSELLYAASIKLFEIAIGRGRPLLQRFIKATADFFFVGYFIDVKDEAYKENAKRFLARAKKALNAEINYIDVNFFDENSNEDFRRIIFKRSYLRIRQLMSLPV